MQASAAGSLDLVEMMGGGRHLSQQGRVLPRPPPPPMLLRAHPKQEFRPPRPVALDQMCPPPSPLGHPRLRQGAASSLSGGGGEGSTAPALTWVVSSLPPLPVALQSDFYTSASAPNAPESALPGTKACPAEDQGLIQLAAQQFQNQHGGDGRQSPTDRQARTRPNLLREGGELCQAELRPRTRERGKESASEHVQKAFSPP